MFSKYKYKFILGLGNNILPEGVKSVNDKKFNQNFEVITELHVYQISLQINMIKCFAKLCTGCFPFLLFSTKRKKLGNDTISSF